MVLNRGTLKKILIILVFYMPFLRFFTANFEVLGILTKLMYPMFIGAIVLGWYFGRSGNSSGSRFANWLKIAAVLQLLLAIISWVLNVYSLGEFAYGIYYHLRLPIFMILAIIYLDRADVEKVNDFIIKVIYVDAIFMTYQFLFMGLRQDFLGGLFGNTQGCNGIQNVICCLGLAIVTSKYLYKEIDLRGLLLYIFVTCYMAAIAELIIYFVEVALVILLSFIITKERNISIRKTAMLVMGILAVIVGGALLIRYFPTKARFLNFDEILKYLGVNDSGVYTISRIHGISQVKAIYMNNEITALFGLGLGRTLEGTPFHSMYGKINYTWFSSTLLMLESGYFGIILRLYILATSAIKAYRNLRLTEYSRKSLHLVGLLMAVLSIILFFYNNTLDDRYCVYMIAYGLAMSCIIKKEDGRIVA